MVDFLKIGVRYPKKGLIEIYPKFVVKSTSSDLMIRGGDFYAIWVEDERRWSTDEQDAIDIIDRELSKEYENYRAKEDANVRVLYMWDAETGMIDRWHKYCQKQMRDNFKMLDEKIIFSNTEVKKRDYSSKRLEYPLEAMDTPAYDQLMSVLYSPEERHKIEWAIGSIVNGDSKKIQKFVTLYGPPGSGKGTVLEIIDRLFSGYTTTFSAKNLGMSGAQFALEPFKNNPLVGIQTDGDLSRIEDNSRLNSLISHEKMIVNEKHKTQYTAKFKTFIFLGTNKPVKITDAKSGLLRRLIDVNPSGNKVPKREYDKLMDMINFELGGIASHCLKVYEDDPRFYDGYVPEKMISSTNDFYNFVIDNYFELSDQDAVTLKQAWEMYKTWCDDAKMQYPLNKRAFKDELMNYFETFEERGVIGGERVRSVFIGFKRDLFKKKEASDGQRNVEQEEERTSWLRFDCQQSLFDEQFRGCKAQLAGQDDKPTTKWDNVKTTLADIDTTRVHYVQLPSEIITIDFDIPDEDGGKSLERNMKAAEKWPPTYAELSKSGSGIHLHYIYEGDVSELSSVYDDHIEVKVMTGNSSLRRRLTKCNDLPIAKISSGLKRKEKKMKNEGAIKSEKKLRELIVRNLNKEIHPGTKPSIDFIQKILDDAYDSGMKYDVSDMRQAILTFAMGSTHQADYCVKLVGKMKFKSEEFSETESKMDELVFYDIEVYPNYFLVNWKVAEDVDWNLVKTMDRSEKAKYFLDLIVNHKKKIVRMMNPTPTDIEKILGYKLVGFNCRRYDNHICYGRLMGFSNEGCYNQSQKIINQLKGAFFGEAYNLSYTDVYDFCSKKQGLKKWEIELGFHHQEMGLPWDQPVAEELWEKVAEYCDNDVLATELVFLCNHDDFVARQILADIAGMTVNDTSNSLTTRIILGTERRPQSQFNYRFMGDLSDASQSVTNDIIKKAGLVGEVDLEFTRFDSKGRPLFPGYTFEFGKSMYRGEEVGEGGYVYAETGIWTDVVLLDIASMHPSSIVAENLFGDYTKNFEALLNVRLAIKHGDFEGAKKIMPPLAKYLDDPEMADTLSQALKIPINSVYGLTAAKFENPFRDPRNADNIVAKRGALFMINLKNELKRHGWRIVSCKTDSVKLPNAGPEIIDFVTRYGKMYGYNFEHECTYDRLCLVNDAVYIAKYASVEKCYDLYGKKYVDKDKDTCKKNKKKAGKWEATGTQFQVPYVYKTLFSHEDIKFDDLCETKSVSKGELYLDMNEDLPDVSEEEKELKKLEEKYRKGELSDTSFEPEYARLTAEIAKGHNYVFVGRVGQFCPMKEGAGGGVLYRYQDGKYYAATGTKGYRWLESEVVKTLKKEDLIDTSYYISLVDEAKEAINKYGDFEMFANNEIYVSPDFMNIPDDAPEELPWDPVPDEAGKEHP